MGAGVEVGEVRFVGLALPGALDALGVLRRTDVGFEVVYLVLVFEGAEGANGPAVCDGEAVGVLGQLAGLH